MSLTGRCYCGRVRFEAKGEPMMAGQCYCRECQYTSGGGPHSFYAMPVDGFAYTAGAPKSFRRDDIANPRIREFCADCGTPLTTRNEARPFVIVKVGVLDDPSAFKPEVAIQVADKQPWHNIPEGLRQFDRWPWS